VEPRKRKRLLLAFAGIVAVVAGRFLFLNHNTEPTYDGRPLSEWVVIAAPMNPSPYTQSEKEAATEAIRAIGTNAVPHLVEWIGYEPKGLRKLMSLGYRMVPNRFQTNPSVLFVADKPAIRALGAEESFSIFGPSAAPAIPALAQILRSTNSYDSTRGKAFAALAFIGPKAFPTMLGVVSNFSQRSDLWITIGPLMRLKRHEFDQFLPAILPHLQSTNLPLALEVSKTLRDLSLDSELIAPAFARCLDDPRWEVRAEAATSLMPMGWRAQAALPALVKALGDTNATVRSNAAAAINRIDPSALPEELRTPASPP